MKKLTLSFSFLLTVLLFFSACKKELSLEVSGLGGQAKGTLTDSSGNCKDIDVRGTYVVDQAVTDSNYLLVKMNFTAQGKYKISSDTVNGMWFVDSGFALQNGAAIVKVRAHGKPILPQQSDFILTFNGTYCAFSVITINPGVNNDYFPNTFGSSWTYQYIPTLLPNNNEFTTTVLTSTYNIDTLTFFEYQQVDLQNNQSSYYFAKDGKGNHYAFSTIEYDYTLVLDSIVPVKYISYPFLKEGASVGDTWEVVQPGVSWYKSKSGTSKAIFTVVQKGGSYVAGGQTYSDVIIMKREIQFQETGGVYTKISEGNAYYARNVGLVDQVFPLTGGTRSITLKSYTIK